MFVGAEVKCFGFFREVEVNQKTGKKRKDEMTFEIEP